MSSSERTDYVVFKDDSNVVQLHSCPRDAVPGQTIESVKIPENCRNMDASMLSRFQCRIPDGSEPVPFAEYKIRLLEIMNLQSMEGTLKDLEAQKKELNRMEADLAKLDKIVARNPSPPLTEEAEKARGSVENLKKSIAAVEAEVNRNKVQFETYKTIIASLDCNSSAQFFKGQGEFTQILQPFQNPEGDVTIERTVNQLLIEDRPFAHNFEVDVSDTGTVGAVSIQIEMNHDYPSEVGIRITSPDGKVVKLDELNLITPGRQVQIGLINSSYTPELAKITGAKIKGKWKIEYGDSRSDTGTVRKITVKLHRIGSSPGKAAETYRVPLAAFSIPKETKITYPIFVGMTQLISDFDFGFTTNAAIEASLTAPNGKQLTFSPGQNGYMLDPATVKNVINSNAAGVWMLNLNNPGNSPATLTPTGNAAVINKAPPQSTNSGNSSSSGTSGQNTSPVAGAVSKSDVDSAIARNRSQFATYNQDTNAVDGCKAAGASAGWSPTMQEYYCSLPGTNPDIRTCFTYSVRGAGNFKKRTYPEAYDFCATSYTGTPMKWVRDTQDAVFKAVMIDKKF
jgi:subtilisin-like proprotein convertase family protein